MKKQTWIAVIGILVLLVPCANLWQYKTYKNNNPQIASASWTPAGRNFVIIATVLVGASDSTKIGAAAAGQAA